MQLPHNPFKKALAEGRAPIGLWASLPSPYAVEVIAGAGFDWLLIDTEHTPADIETVLAELQAASAYGSHPVVRLPWNDFVAVKRYLDIGALTLMIPQIADAKEARAAVEAMRYPPRGIRGVGGTTRATRFGRVADYARHAEEQLCLLVQVETREALDQIEAIAAVDGVDGIFIGPADLHASFGFVGERANPEVMARIDDGIRRIRAAGKAPGILTSSEPDAKHWLALGAQFVAVGSDVGLLARSADALIARFRP